MKLFTYTIPPIVHAKYVPYFRLEMRLKVAQMLYQAPSRLTV